MRADDDEAPPPPPPDVQNPEDDDDDDLVNEVRHGWNINPRHIVVLSGDETRHWYVRDPADESVLRPIPEHEVRRMRESGIFPPVRPYVGEHDEGEPRARVSTPIHMHMDNPPATERAAADGWSAARAAIRSLERLTSQERAFMYTQTFGQSSSDQEAFRRAATAGDTTRNYLQLPTRNAEPVGPRPPISDHDGHVRPRSTLVNMLTSRHNRRPAILPNTNSRSTLRAVATAPLRDQSPINSTPRDDMVAAQLARKLVLKAHRDRIKAPVKKIMEIADEIQSVLKENTYLEIANASRDIHSIIEELDPTTVEGYEAIDEAVDEALNELPQMRERITELEDALSEASIELAEQRNEIQRLKRQIEVHNRIG
jgi:hypothetical protein